MGSGTANKYTGKSGRGTLTHSKPLVLQKSIPYIVTSYMTKCICPRSIIIQKILAVEIKKKSPYNYKWRLAKQKCLVPRWDFSLKHTHFIVFTLQWHAVLADTTTKVNLINTFSTKSSCSQRNCNSGCLGVVSSMWHSHQSQKGKQHAENPKGGSCRLKVTFSNTEDGSLELYKVQELSTW